MSHGCDPSSAYYSIASFGAVVVPTLPAGQLRHGDHRFEWTRAEFENWAGGVAARHGYKVRFEPVGPPDAALGAPSQMAVFTR